MVVERLWHKGVGEIKREMKQGAVLFLPQRPYMSLGTLREQLLYPNSNIDADDTHLHEILITVGLQDVLKRINSELDVVQRWDEQLSLGEQQRLSVARLLVQRPVFALVDEVTSANDPAHVSWTVLATFNRKLFRACYPMLLGAVVGWARLMWKDLVVVAHVVAPKRLTPP